MPQLKSASLCRLDASGCTDTPSIILEWADCAVAEVRNSLGGITVLAHVWPYSHGGNDFLGCSIRCDGANSAPGYALTFVIGPDVDLAEVCEPHVPTMADALHMLGIVLDALDARMTLGRRGTEVNEDVLCEPLGMGRKSGPMRRAGARRRVIRCPENNLREFA